MIITTAVIKGGTGKTTTAAALAQAAAKDRKKVLCIDLDPQGNFTAFLSADPNAPGAYQLIEGRPAAGLIQTTGQKIDVIPGSPDLATLKTSPGSAERLNRALEPLKSKYDVIIIDTPPTIGEMTYNALYTADVLLIPLEGDTGSLQGFYQITDIAGQIIQSAPAALLSFIGALLTRYDKRSKFSKHMKETIKQAAEDTGAHYMGEIRAGIAIREAQGLQVSLYDYAPQSKPAQDYTALYKAVKKYKKSNSTQEV